MSDAIIGDGNVPEISRFYGIVIRMYFDEHNPPHFHAAYAGAVAEIQIEPVRVLKGRLPKRARSFVIEWATLHQQELRDNWNRLRAQRSPRAIAPLE